MAQVVGEVSGSRLPGWRRAPIARLAGALPPPFLPSFSVPRCFLNACVLGALQPSAPPYHQMRVAKAASLYACIV